jgi:malonyl-CoA/methylmalonyl-CoA synthetase
MLAVAERREMSLTGRLLDLERHSPDQTAMRFGDRSLTYRELSTQVGRVAASIRGHHRIAVFATPTLETCVAVVGALVAGVTVVTVNPAAGLRELEHIIVDSAPSLVLSVPGVELPPALAALPRLDVTLTDPDDLITPTTMDAEPEPESIAFVVYTSGTTGPPKGVLLSRRAVARNLDAIAEAWAWTGEDVVMHGLPVFHVHGLILGVVGPLRRGGTLHHIGPFSPAVLGRELGAATRPVMVFGVPTMYHRLAAAADSDPALAEAIGQARLLISGSAGLAPRDHEQIARSSGQRIVERYGMTETLMICSVRADGDRRAGIVGWPVAGTEVQLVDETGHPLPDTGEIGEIEVRGDSLFTGYLNRPDATAEALRAGWFRTGDVAVREPDGALRIIGRRATDLIKSGGYKIGAGEIEDTIADHPAVVEAAVTGEPDDDLGERIVAWVVRRPGAVVSEQDIVEHVVRLLAPHKRPRTVRFIEELPRNAMGKVTKRALIS